ncbi:hypothetical protein COV20_02750 [Candidatus Woesearchaeota archaeon CG10_big_fil_rev_8_21_14_0_10_45_16]|nr:MAG: hypothetical protein COV20_02750 [Candidatus Woesearchaeota archaeon CG10_big_fil_rev_8_21_14_0_10_45_16]
MGELLYFLEKPHRRLEAKVGGGVLTVGQLTVQLYGLEEIPESDFHPFEDGYTLSMDASVIRIINGSRDDITKALAGLHRFVSRTRGKAIVVVKHGYVGLDVLMDDGFEPIGEIDNLSDRLLVLEKDYASIVAPLVNYKR